MSSAGGGSNAGGEMAAGLSGLSSLIRDTADLMDRGTGTMNRLQSQMSALGRRR